MQPALFMGITSIDPSRLKRVAYPAHLPDTWCMWTWDGTIWIDQDMYPTACTGWKDKFGVEHQLSDGDQLAINLHHDRSVSISLNKFLQRNVFRNLPQVPLWVAIGSHVGQISVDEKG